ncbi:MAG: c-type cytochrome domain-containing protein, partial [Chthoniobacteraceae bacterium]
MRFLPFLTITFAIALLRSGNGAAASEEGIEFFEKKVRPLLAERCFKCHSADEKVKGGLRLDFRDGWAKGGDSGPAIVAGKPDESLLIEAVRYRDEDFAMPPKRKLPDAEIAVLEEWVAMGAPDPRSESANSGPARKAGLSIEESREFWSYRKPKLSPVPDVSAKDWPQGD